MAKPNMWMPLYIGDYLRDTLGLSRAEHGSYMLLIMAYWSNGGPLPADNECLRDIAKCPHDEWMRTKGLMLRFFREKEGFWTHKRIDEELQKSREMYAKKIHQTSAALRSRGIVTSHVTSDETSNVTEPTTTTTITTTEEQSQSQRREIEKRLSAMFGRNGKPITDYGEQSAIAEISRREDILNEVGIMESFQQKEKKYFPRSLSRLVNNWEQYLDHARTWRPNRTPQEEQRLKNLMAQI